MRKVTRASRIHLSYPCARQLPSRTRRRRGREGKRLSGWRLDLIQQNVGNYHHKQAGHLATFARYLKVLLVKRQRVEQVRLLPPCVREKIINLTQALGKARTHARKHTHTRTRTHRQAYGGATLHYYGAARTFRITMGSPCIFEPFIFRTHFWQSGREPKRKRASPHLCPS